jgi:hypothetical protein
LPQNTNDRPDLTVKYRRAIRSRYKHQGMVGSRHKFHGAVKSRHETPSNGWIFRKISLTNQPYPTKKFYTASFSFFFSKLNHYSKVCHFIRLNCHLFYQETSRGTSGQVRTSANLCSPSSSKDSPGNISSNLQQWILLER